MKRPYISISGTLDELILMEAILAYYYDESNEDWNNQMLTREISISNMKRDGSWLICCDKPKMIGYYSHKGTFPENNFKASELTEILTYIEEYEKN